MAFSFGSASIVSPVAASQGAVQTGPDLEDIQTEALGFLALAGEAKVRLLPTPWPANHPPPPTSSLLSIASHKGLVAAGGPDAVILATTSAVRKAFDGASSAGENYKPFEPQLTIPMQMRISQLAFSADETYLVLSAEDGGGLAVYEVASLLQGSTQSAFEMSTNGQSLRALVPNPTPERGAFFAAVTVDGSLMIANLKERTFFSGPNGQALRSGVSCVSWSARGKQLIAGLGDGTSHQMTPEGEAKGDIPKPPNVNNGDFVSSLIWLENNVFLVVHTPLSFGSDMAPSSTFHIVTRQPPNNFMFQKISDPAGPFGLNRSPPHHFMLRLRDFPPSLQDIVAVASSASTDIGLFTRSKLPLTSDKPADKVCGVFTMTEMSDDSRRAQLPLSEAGMSDTSPIGVSFDLSSNEKVPRPIPGDEIDESPTPLPALMVLNNEGILAAWWVIYTESIRQRTIYSSLVVAPPNSQASPAPKQVPSAFEGPAFGSQTTSSTLNTTRPGTSFGTSSLPGPSSGSFGAPSGLGPQQSVWGKPTGSIVPPNAAPSFGFSATQASGSPFSTPVFGSANTPSFGSSGLPGNRTSPWGTTQSSASTLGQTDETGKASSVFSANPGATPGGFASFATGNGFGNPGASTVAGSSIFAAKAASTSFGSPSSKPPISANSVFGDPSQPASQLKNPFGSNRFVVGSTFKADSSAIEDKPAPLSETKGSFFGGGFETALGDTVKAENGSSNDADMDSTKSGESIKPSVSLEVPITIPVSTAALGSLSSPSEAIQSTGGLFGAPPTASISATNSMSTGFSVSNLMNPAPSTKSPTPNGTPAPDLASVKTPTPTSPLIKVEPDTEVSSFRDRINEAPLPPESTTKDSYAAGDTSNSSMGTDAPLPPDFIPRVIPVSSSASDLSPLSISDKSTPINQHKTHASPEKTPISEIPGIPEDEEDDSDFLTEEEEDDEVGKEEDNEADFEVEADGDSQSERLSGEEGSGEDVAQDLSPTSETNHTPAFTPQNSFGGAHHTPDTHFTKITKSRPIDSRAGPLFGEIKLTAPVLLPPNLQASPRSPSPVRSALPGRILRPDTSRSFSAPSAAFHPLNTPKVPTRTILSPGYAETLLGEQEPSAEQARAELRAQKESDEKRALVDDEDEMMQKHLASEITGTRTLDEFVAHSDYVREGLKESIPHQVELVYRDINSMIDTLGFNARSLSAFVKGHTEQYKEEGRTRDDLEDYDDWCLVEIENLSSIIDKDLTQALDVGRVVEVSSKLAACNDIQKDMVRLRAKHGDVKKLIDSHRDTQNSSHTRSLPLSAEQAAQQHDLRRDYMKFQRLLSGAEEALTILRAKLASQESSNGRSSVSTGPSVEAIMRTIAKMTSMAEKRSGDIDVLEGQMRRMRFDSSVSVASREGSPLTTPQKNRSSTHIPGTSSTYSLFYTPDSARDSRRDLKSSLMSSTHSRAIGSPPRKKISGYSLEEKTQLKARLTRKKEVAARLKATLLKTGPSVRVMEVD